MKILDLIETALEEAGYHNYSRVEDTILWVGNSDDELNRTLDLSSPKSYQIQIGAAMNYFENKSPDLKKILEIFVKALSKEISENISKSNTTVLERKYIIQESDEIIDLGTNSSLRSLWKRKKS